MTQERLRVRTRHRARGFSLIELLGVMLVLLIATAMLLKLGSAYGTGGSVRGTAEKLAGEIRMARLRAINLGTKQGIAFNGTDNSYTLFADTGIGSQNSFDPTDDDVLGRYALPTGIEFGYLTGTKRPGTSALVTQALNCTAWGSDAVLILTPRGRNIVNNPCYFYVRSLAQANLQIQSAITAYQTGGVRVWQWNGDEQFDSRKWK